MGGAGVHGPATRRRRRLGAVRRGLAGPAAAGLRRWRGDGATAHRRRRSTATMTGVDRRWAALERRARELEPSPNGMVARPVFAPLAVVGRAAVDARPGTASSACSPARSAAAGSTRWCSPGGSGSARPSSSTSRTPSAAWPRAHRRARPTRSGATAARSWARRRSASPEPRAARSGRWPSRARSGAAPTRRRTRPSAAELLASREGPRGAGDRRRRDPRTSWRRSPRRSRSRPSPSVMTLRFVQHLATEISGTLPEARGLLSLAGLLHPTPAVGGEPRDVALALVDEHEGFDRGWYAGPDRLARARTATASCASPCAAGSSTAPGRRCSRAAGSSPTPTRPPSGRSRGSSSGPSCRRWASRRTSA